MSQDTKKSGILAQIFVGLVLAACVGGSSPWWLKELKELVYGQPGTAQTGHSAPPSSIDSEIAKLDREELVARQKKLEEQLAELRQGQREDILFQPSQNSAVDVSGTWNGADGSVYTFYQTGTSLTMEEFSPGLGQTAVGQGSLNGREMTLTIATALFSQGTLKMTVSPDASEMSGTYIDHTYGVQNSYTFTR